MNLKALVNKLNRSILKDSKISFFVRCYSENFDKSPHHTSLKEYKDSSLNTNYGQMQPFGSLQIQYWSETAAVKKARKDLSFPRTVNCSADAVQYAQSLNDIPDSPSSFLYWLKNRAESKSLKEQTFLPRRVEVLKADLAAAHFITGRGGSVKFVGKPDWVGRKEKVKTLPRLYTPGMFVECIKAEGTGLLYEGLKNISNLRHLTYLSLKNLDSVNEWFLDWISVEYHYSLKHLDLSGCKNVTYRALSCFHRFENLEVLEVEGIPDTPEFKLACLMLLDIMPELDIRGVNLTLPDKIELKSSEETVKLSES